MPELASVLTLLFQGQALIRFNVHSGLVGFIWLPLLLLCRLLLEEVNLSERGKTVCLNLGEKRQ